MPSPNIAIEKRILAVGDINIPKEALGAVGEEAELSVCTFAKCHRKRNRPFRIPVDFLRAIRRYGRAVIHEDKRPCGAKLSTDQLHPALTLPNLAFLLQ